MRVIFRHILSNEGQYLSGVHFEIDAVECDNAWKSFADSTHRAGQGPVSRFAFHRRQRPTCCGAKPVDFGRKFIDPIFLDHESGHKDLFSGRDHRAIAASTLDMRTIDW
jgi:hypothetical protein